MTALPYESVDVPPQLPFPDQRGGMKAVGVILIVLGAFAGCLGIGSGLFTLMALQMPNPPGGRGAMPPASQMIQGVLVWVAASGVLITVGVGSLRIRRWSRAAALVATGSWSVSALLALVTFIIVAPGMRRAMAAAAANAGATGAPVATAQTTGLVMVIVFIALMGVLLPAGLFLFYRRPAVQQTIDYFSPGTAWSDLCPTPVVAAAAWLLVSAAMFLLMSPRGVVPMFGTLVGPPIGIAAFVVMAAVGAALAVGMLRLRPWAWWATLILVAVGAASSVITFTRVDPVEMYRLSGSTQEQIDLMLQSGVNLKVTMILNPLMYGALGLGYLSWIGKYFSGKRQHLQDQPAPAAQTNAPTDARA